MFNLGNRIKHLRKQNKMTMESLAKKIGITQPQLSRIENNKNMAQLDTIEKICETLNISLVDFFSCDEKSTTLPKYFIEFYNENSQLTQNQLDQLSKFLKSLK